MMQQEMYVSPEGWLAVASPLIRMRHALGGAVFWIKRTGKQANPRHGHGSRLGARELWHKS